MFIVQNKNFTISAAIMLTVTLLLKFLTRFFPYCLSHFCSFLSMKFFANLRTYEANHYPTLDSKHVKISEPFRVVTHVDCEPHLIIFF